MSYVKIYGLKRTGTNYISSLLYNNFKNITIFSNVGGWKHGKIIKLPNKNNLLNTVDGQTKQKHLKKINVTLDLFSQGRVKFVVMIKNPYLWMVSVCRFEFKKQTRENVIKFVKMWNDTYANYKKHIENGDAIFINYEDVLRDLNVLQILEDKFGLEKKHDKFVNIKNQMDANSDCNLCGTTGHVFNKKNYYTNNDDSIKKYVGNDIINIINEYISEDVLLFYGYQKINI